MIFWQGKGIFALLIPVSVLIILSLIVSLVFGIDDDFSDEKLFLFSTFLISAFLCWFVGKRINSSKPRLLIDPDTNEEILFKQKHTFWFISLEYWGFIWAIISIIVLFTSS